MDLTYEYTGSGTFDNSSNTYTFNLIVDYTDDEVSGGLSASNSRAFESYYYNGAEGQNEIFGQSYGTYAPTFSLDYTGMYPTTGALSVTTYNYQYNPVTGIGQFVPSVEQASDVAIQSSQVVTCFVAGTRILTTRGEIAVEDLAVGDLVVTSAGATREICWLGHRAIDCRSHPRPNTVRPVRIAAHAFGDNRPARDLRVSPGHSICVDVVGEVLIPAVALVEGIAIVQEAVERVTYWHVELADHDVILAEGLPCESYLEMGNRGFFVEAATTALWAMPDAPAASHADFCRPYVADGPQLAAVRAMLRERQAVAGLPLKATAAG